MDGSRFDDIARAMVNSSSRRGLLKGIGGLFGIAIGLAGAGEAAAGPAPRNCKNEGSKCKGNDGCCAGNCCGGRCHAPCPAGQTLDANCICIQVVPGSECSESRPCPDSGNLCWPDVCGVDGFCTQVQLDCNDGNPCSDGSCSDTLGCQYSPKPAGLACPGGFCDALGTCRPPCSSAAECPTSEDPCLVAVCESGVCNLRTNPCDDGNPCTDGFCSFGVGCEYSPKPAGIACPGGFCDALGTCRLSCESAADCPPPPRGEKCLVSVCESEVCYLRGKNCDTGNPCTDDYCVEGTGCVSNPGPHVGTPCPGDGICNKKGICVS